MSPLAADPRKPIFRTVGAFWASASWTEVSIAAAMMSATIFLLMGFLLLPLASWVASYLMTLSALASTFGGIVRPTCLAAFRLMMNSNFVGCSTGRSAGLAPFKILSTYVAARRSKSYWFTP